MLVAIFMVDPKRPDFKVPLYPGAQVLIRKMDSNAPTCSMDIYSSKPWTVYLWYVNEQGFWVTWIFRNIRYNDTNYSIFAQVLAIHLKHDGSRIEFKHQLKICKILSPEDLMQLLQSKYGWRLGQDYGKGVKNSSTSQRKSKHRDSRGRGHSKR